jgi:predicted DsbA family dithiol-disulfide isomerase
VFPLLEHVLEKYPNEVKLVHKNFPLKNHKYAKKAAAAALAANRQGNFWEFNDRLFKNANRLNDQKLQKSARVLTLNEKKFKKDMQDPEILKIISQNIRDGVEAGVRGTPTIFINGRLLRQRTLEEFQRIIEKELEKVKKINNRARPTCPSALPKSLPCRFCVPIKLTVATLPYVYIFYFKVTIVTHRYLRRLHTLGK